MDIKFRYLPDSPPVFDAAKSRARWAAARADYLAGGSAPEVCERHGLSLRTFRHRAKIEGWRRADQPAPFIAPDPAPTPEPALDPAPTSQNQPLVIPDAPTGAIRDQPLTTLEMVDKCWSHVQAAVAAGQLIQARGWLRLYRELKPLVPFTEIEAREAEQAAPAQTLAPPLHCFSAPESHTPEPAPEPEPSPAPSAPEPDPTGDLVRLTTRLAAIARQAEKAALQPDLAPPLHCFSDPECNPADDLTRLVADIQALTGKAERAVADDALALRLHCFSGAEGDGVGPGP
ncbi:MAG: hypothetical protein ACK4FB_00710 [Brevundimonas sp.]|uniref:hypothetical protein n=1 Tax=Brevundimonas sp. TaxID=1871086 RepID=UPI00391A8CD9